MFEDREQFLNVVKKLAAEDVRKCLAGIEVTHPELTEQILKKKEAALQQSIKQQNKTKNTKARNSETNNNTRNTTTAVAQQPEVKNNRNTSPNNATNNSGRGNTRNQQSANSANSSSAKSPQSPSNDSHQQPERDENVPVRHPPVVKPFSQHVMKPTKATIMREQLMQLKLEQQREKEMYHAMLKSKYGDPNSMMYKKMVKKKPAASASANSSASQGGAGSSSANAQVASQPPPPPSRAQAPAAGSSPAPDSKPEAVAESQAIEEVHKLKEALHSSDVLQRKLQKKIRRLQMKMEKDERGRAQEQQLEILQKLYEQLQTRHPQTPKPAEKALAVTETQTSPMKPSPTKKLLKASPEQVALIEEWILDEVLAGEVEYMNSLEMYTNNFVESQKKNEEKKAQEARRRIQDIDTVLAKISEAEKLEREILLKYAHKQTGDPYAKPIVINPNAEPETSVARLSYLTSKVKRTKAIEEILAAEEAKIKQEELARKGDFFTNKIIQGLHEYKYSFKEFADRDPDFVQEKSVFVMEEIAEQIVEDLMNEMAGEVLETHEKIASGVFESEFDMQTSLDASS